MPQRTAETYPPAMEKIYALRDNCRQFNLPLIDINDDQQGIVHVIGPELGIALPGCTLVCGDSHTASGGGVGAIAWGIGSTQVGHVMAAQALAQYRPKTMRILFRGKLQDWISAKDMILFLIGKVGVAAGTGYAVEYAGEAIRSLGVDGRITICNMSIELGARYGFVAPDDATFEYLSGRTFAPKGEHWDNAINHWRSLPSDDDAAFDATVEIDCGEIVPQVTWGNSPQDLIAVNGRIPDPAMAPDADKRGAMERAIQYMNVTPGAPIEGTPIDVAFIGSCTNSRLSDLEAAARVLRGRRVAPNVRALAVPGSLAIKRAAEAKGLHKIFEDAGFEWRASGCSMCIANNGDIVRPGQRSISTSNRNFENRQGLGSRTHLASPAMVAAAAVAGKITDVRKL